jgi:hypothetical protein
MTIGSVLPMMVFGVRMRSRILPSEARETINPGTFAARVRSNDSAGARSISSEVMIVPAVGLPEKGSAVGAGCAVFPEAHPEMSPARIPQDTTRRGDGNILLLAKA